MSLDTEALELGLDLVSGWLMVSGIRTTFHCQLSHCLFLAVGGWSIAQPPPLAGPVLRLRTLIHWQSPETMTMFNYRYFLYL